VEVELEAAKEEKEKVKMEVRRGKGARFPITSRCPYECFSPRSAAG
jgi:hypothetical protein